MSDVITNTNSHDAVKNLGDDGDVFTTEEDDEENKKNDDMLSESFNSQTTEEFIDSVISEVISEHIGSESSDGIIFDENTTLSTNNSVDENATLSTNNDVDENTTSTNNGVVESSAGNIVDNNINKIIENAISTEDLQASLSNREQLENTRYDQNSQHGTVVQDATLESKTFPGSNVSSEEKDEPSDSDTHKIENITASGTSHAGLKTGIDDKDEKEESKQKSADCEITESFETQTAEQLVNIKISTATENHSPALRTDLVGNKLMDEDLTHNVVDPELKLDNTLANTTSVTNSEETEPIKDKTERIDSKEENTKLIIKLEKNETESVPNQHEVTNPDTEGTNTGTVETEEKNPGAEEKNTDTETSSNNEPDATKLSPEELKEENKDDEWMDILGNGLLKKKIIRKGKGRDSRPNNGDTVNIRYEGKLEDGTVVERSDSLELILGDLDVIQGMDLAIALMEDGEVCTLYTAARYAYTVYGRPDFKPPIPQNANLTYEIEILSITEGVPVEELSSQQRVAYGDKKRARGNDLYIRKDYAGAIDSYKRGLKYLEGSADKDVVRMKTMCLNNVSAAQLKVKAYNMALQSLNIVLDLEPENVKAIFRKAKCLEGLGKDEDALECMKKAALLDPNNKQLLKDLGHIRSKVAVVHKKEKEIYQRMFQQGQQTPEQKDNEEEAMWPYIVGTVLITAMAVVGGMFWNKYR